MYNTLQVSTLTSATHLPAGEVNALLRVGLLLAHVPFRASLRLGATQSVTYDVGLPFVRTLIHHNERGVGQMELSKATFNFLPRDFAVKAKKHSTAT